MKLIVVTGLSGSGKTVALHTLEDLGYNCIDNLPIFLLQELARSLMERRDPNFERIAVGIDARNASDRLHTLPPLVRELRDQGIECQIVFLDAQADILSRRFGETRRKHPLADGQRPLEDAMRQERQLLEPILACADLYIDTTHTNIHQLRSQIHERLEQVRVRASILLMSFGFKHGVPRDANFIFDVRCLPNPYWQPELRPFTGQDPTVAKFLEESPGVNEMAADLHGFLERWIPSFEADGRGYLTVSFGCTGGRHRSVYLAERLGRELSQPGRTVMVRHRELSA